MDRIVDVYGNASHRKAEGGNAHYNREHAWPKSHGFPRDRDDNYPYTDCHHLFLADPNYDSSRSNRYYGTCDAECREKPTEGGEGGEASGYPGRSNWTSSDLWETWVGRRGDVARALLYMDVRYEGGTHGVTGAAEPDLVLTDDVSRIESEGHNREVAHMGELSVLLEWHREDPVDARERQRQAAVFAAQGNRNPFIDRPDWAACVFEGECAAEPAEPGEPSGPGEGGGDEEVSAALGRLLERIEAVEQELDAIKSEIEELSGGEEP